MVEMRGSLPDCRTDDDGSICSSREFERFFLDAGSSEKFAGFRSRRSGILDLVRLRSGITDCDHDDQALVRPVKAT